MNITGGFRPCVQDTGGSSAWGAFGVASRVDTDKVVSGTWKNSDPIPRFGFDAARSWSGETSSNGNHSHTITSTLNKSPIYGNNETVQPPSVGLKVKTRFK